MSDIPSKSAGRRFIVEAIEQLAAARAINLTCFAGEWVLQLTQQGQTHLVYGYDFDLNTSAARLVVSDKSCFSDLLASTGVPHVPHRLFLHPDMKGFVPEAGNWEAALQFARVHDYNLVCKINQGTGGSHVYRISSQRELEAAFQEIHGVYRGLSVSPYFPIDREYRLIILKDDILLAYEKIRPAVTGDGTSTLKELLAAAYLSGVITEKILASALEHPTCPLHTIPVHGESVPVLWKHNLGKGAGLRLLNDDEVASVRNLALRAFKTSGLTVGAVDIIWTNGSPLVLEINAGIMLENFARHAAGGKERATAVYAHILDLMFF